MNLSLLELWASPQVKKIRKTRPSSDPWPRNPSVHPRPALLLRPFRIHVAGIPAALPPVLSYCSTSNQSGIGLGLTTSTTDCP